MQNNLILLDLPVHHYKQSMILFTISWYACTEEKFKMKTRPSRSDNSRIDFVNLWGGRNVSFHLEASRFLRTISSVCTFAYFSSNHFYNRNINVVCCQNYTQMSTADDMIENGTWELIVLWTIDHKTIYRFGWLFLNGTITKNELIRCCPWWKLTDNATERG